MQCALLFNTNLIVDIRLTDHHGRQFLMSFFIDIFGDLQIRNWLTHKGKKFDESRFLAIVGWLQKEEIFADKVTKLQLCQYLTDSKIFRLSLRSMQNAMCFSIKTNTLLKNHKNSAKTRGF